MEANMPTKQQLEQQNAELLATNNQLLNQIPERIRELIEKSEVFASAINTINTKTKEISDEGNSHLSKFNAEAEAHFKKLEELQSSIINDGKINMQNIVKRVEQLQTHENHLIEKYEDYLKDLSDSSDAFFATYEDRKAEVAKKVSDGISEAKEEIVEEMRKFRNLKEQFHSLAKDGFNSKANSLITQAYEKNANSHQTKEIVFQTICGLSIASAIGVLLCWLLGLINSPVDQTSDYYWLPITTITSLFLFLARWAARIAYRSGLESRRLNQYALDLSTMPAYFYQPLLTQEDKEFHSVGRTIITEKSKKMFGNIDRFDEQHSHSPMELIWKWVTKKFEGSDSGDSISSMSQEEPIAKPKTSPKPKAKKTIASDDE